LAAGVIIKTTLVEPGLHVELVEREIPSASLKAGSSLLLKNGSSKDDNPL
jgi:hypothetical protein